MANAADVVTVRRVMPDEPADELADDLGAAVEECSEAPERSLPSPAGPDQRRQRELLRELALRALI